MYYTLVGQSRMNNPNNDYEVIFGDYDKDCVKFELDVSKGDYKNMKIITTHTPPKDIVIRQLIEGL